jgi:exosortase C (VPDSG-CTERM-specific)
MSPDNFKELIKPPGPNPGASAPSGRRHPVVGLAPPLRNFVWMTLGLLLCFAIPLWNLVKLAAHSEFFSYILLIPFISFYLIWQKKEKPSLTSPSCRGMTAGFLAAGLAVLAAYWLVFRPHWKLMEDESLVVLVTSFLLLFAGICGWTLGRGFLVANAFPLAFLAFLIPIPAVAMSAIDSFLQSGSAVVAWGFFTLSGTPFVQDGLVFQLPDITLQIAPECSGIHSSLVLFITSLLAGHLFLRTPWRRTLFVLVVLPLGILRNGFRVFTIGELCVHLGPQMIDSPIHHKGGPLFFVLSLIPLFVLLVVLQRTERGGAKPKARGTPA